MNRQDAKRQAGRHGRDFGGAIYFGDYLSAPAYVHYAARDCVERRTADGCNRAE